MKLIEDGQADLTVTIPPHFEEHLIRYQESQIEARINAFNATKSAVAGGHTQQVVQQLVIQLNESTGMEELAVIPIRTVEVNCYSPQINYRNYIIPGLVVMPITMIAFILLALNMIREKEAGAIKQVNVMPIHPLIFMLFKALPYIIISVFMVFPIHPVVGLLYGLWPRDNVGMIIVGTMFHVLAMGGLGLFITNFTYAQQQTMSSFFFVLISFILLRELFTPIEGMPSWAHALAMSHPSAHYSILVRTYYLKPVAFTELWRELTVFSVFIVVNATVTILAYHKRTQLSADSLYSNLFLYLWRGQS